MIRAVGFLPMLVLIEPRQQHLAIAVAFGGVVLPEVLPHRESTVERDVERRSGFRLQGSAFVRQNPFVEDQLQGELVRAEPGFVEILRQEAAELGGAAAEAGVGGDAALPGPVVEVGAAGE